MVVLGSAALFRYVPNTYVKWRHAFAGGVFVAVGLELAKSGLAIYIKAVPSFATIYGAFASAPILLLWIYLLWLVVLFGAVIAAYLPSLLGGVGRRGGHAGWQFQLAIEILQRLEAAHARGFAGADMTRLSRSLHVDALELEPVLEALLALDWVGKLEDGRFVLMADPDKAVLMYLAQRVLLKPDEATQFVWKNGLSATSLLRDALPKS
jgi:membrane protein